MLLILLLVELSGLRDYLSTSSTKLMVSIAQKTVSLGGHKTPVSRGLRS